MHHFRKILFPVDFSDRCRGAAHHVEALAAHFGSQVTMLNVVETLGRPGDIDFAAMAFEMQVEHRTQHFSRVLSPFLAEEMKDLPVDRRIRHGDPARVIVRLAAEEHFDLIVLPTHGFGGFRRFLLGSVAAKVLHDAPCPVWTGAHLEDAPAADAIQYGRFLCAIDLPVHHEQALKLAVDLAHEYAGSVTLVHVLPVRSAAPLHYMDADLLLYLTAQAREQVTELCNTLKIKADICIESGDIARGVSKAAEQHSADVIVIGRGHHKGLGRLTTHSYSIIRESPCPVLSV
jgi:nucleotide-binding universal stress UspA family protein